MWAVTVTGAPKIAAISFIAEHERGSRDWYAGAFGRFLFNGDIDTACTLRTIHLAEGVARVRAGSTLLFASEPEAEADEAGWKAAAMLAVVSDPGSSAAAAQTRTRPVARARANHRPKVLLLDHEDSFVNTLSDYFRQLGTDVTTLRVPRGRPTPLPGFSETDLVCLSPGPGAPSEFRLRDSIAAALAVGAPLFGVCLGLQGIVEYFGGRLGVLDTPAHGVDTAIRLSPSRLFDGIAGGFRAGRYHSLYALPDSMPVDLRVVAMSEDGIVMAVEHVSEPVWAVQFHPESIMTKHGEVGRRMLENVLALAAARRTGGRKPLLVTVP
jgi:anthranilate synthase